jgi:hypothetical protein
MRLNPSRSQLPTSRLDFKYTSPIGSVVAALPASGPLSRSLTSLAGSSDVSRHGLAPHMLTRMFPQHLHRPDPVSPLHCSTSQTLLYPSPETRRTRNRLLSSGAPMTHTLTRHKSTRPTLSSSSPRQCSACRQNVSRSLTPDVRSVVLAMSTRCLTLRTVAPSPSKEPSALPHSLPSAANSDLLDSDAHLALPVLRWW